MATVDVAVRARVQPPSSEELVLDFADVFDPPQPRKPEPGWLRESGGVKAAILRWLEEQA